MQKFLKLGLATLVALFWAGEMPATEQRTVVVELFTSEGCSSCPPADALLRQLSGQRKTGEVELILLGEHVEYWNNQGWRDRFSAPVFTQRQYDYVHHLHLATAYTPQVVVDGRIQAVGGNAPAIQKMIAEAASAPKPAVVTLDQPSPDKLHVAVSGPVAQKAHVLLAITEDNLSTSVQAGENDGRTLQHSAVVREMRPLGTMTNGAFEKNVGFALKKDWKPEDILVVVLVQDANSGAILGARSLAVVGR